MTLSKLLRFERLFDRVTPVVLLVLGFTAAAGTAGVVGFVA